MIELRRSGERGHANHGWLDSYHTFSFADYHDPEFMGFRVLRVINEDYIEGGMGFATHGHSDMEIITYVVEGALQHKDTLDNSTVIKPGEVQRMSAGSGIRHSEFNKMPKERTHLLQIWILPEVRGIAPSYAQNSFESRLGQGPFTLLVSRDGRDGSISMNQDVDLYLARWKKGESAEFQMRPGRYAWLQVVKGELRLGQTIAQAGDGLAVGNEFALDLRANSDCEYLLFDLP